jgi:hypothetical protein
MDRTSALPKIDFAIIREHHTSQNSGFEELCVQLFRHSFDKPYLINRHEGSGGDRGVEAFARISATKTIGLQAKYVFHMTRKQWDQIDRSVRTALEKIPELETYIVSAPLNRSPAAMDKWQAWTQKWQMAAKRRTKGRKRVTFIWWGESELLGKLSQAQHHGRARYWFGYPEFSLDALRNRCHIAIADLDQRYTPQRHVVTEAEQQIDAFLHAPEFVARYYDVAGDAVGAWREFDSTMTPSKLQQGLRSGFRSLREDWHALADLIGDGETCPSPANLLPQLGEFRRKLSEFTNDMEDISEKQTGHLPLWNDQRLYTLEILRARESNDRFLALTNFLRRYPCVDTPSLVLLGDAGTGKSHVVANAIKKKLSMDEPAILVLGEYFRTSHDPWGQFFEAVGWEDGFEAYFSMLNALAEQCDQFALVCVDAVNESMDRSLWRTRLAQASARLLPYPNVRLLVSCRSDFADLTVPDAILEGSNTNWTSVNHIGFGESTFEAVSSYFQGYRVKTDHFPPLVSELSNPLFLKTLCEAYEGERLPVGPIALKPVLDRLIAKIVNKVHKDLDCPAQTVRSAIELVVNRIVETGNSRLSLVETQQAIDALLPGRPETQSLYAHIRSNGLLVEVGGTAERDIGVRFAYERFSDFIIADSLLADYPEGGDIHEYARKSTAMQPYITDTRFAFKNRGVVDALAVLVPERARVELPALGRTSRNRACLMDAFLRSLMWRNPNSFTGESRRLLDKSLDSDYRYTLDFLLPLCTIPEHPFNAEHLHGQLAPLPVWRRDASWTIEINERSAMSRRGFLHTLLSWVEGVDRKLVSDDQAILVATMLCWLFSTSNCGFRDRATRATIRLLEGRGDATNAVLRRFASVNDPYVAERVYAVAAGVSMRSPSHADLEALALTVYDEVFADRVAYPHILLRDYARTVLEVALARDCLPRSIDTGSFRPPYGSTLPRIWSEKQMERFDDDYDYYTILSSICPAEMMSYGDFGRYVMGSKLSYFTTIPLTHIECAGSMERRKHSRFSHKKARRWILQRVHTLGWRPDRFGDYERGISQFSNGRQRATIERISKKYQWIALHELLAYLADTYVMTHAWLDEPSAYAGPWEIYARDFDPSFQHFEVWTKESFTPAEHCWWQPYAVYIPGNREIDPNKWIFTKGLPDPKSLIELCDPDNPKHVFWALDGTHLWREAMPFYEDTYESPRLEMWIHIRSWLVRERDHETVLAHLRKTHFWGRGLGLPTLGGNGWLGLYPWAEQYADLREKYPRQDEWLGNIPAPVFISTCEYQNHYVNPPANKSVPSPQVLDAMNARWAGFRLDYVNASREVVAFNPSASEPGPDSCIVDAVEMTSALRRKRLQIVWTLVGERRLIADHEDRAKGQCEVSGVYTLNRERVTGGITRIEKRMFPRRP